MRLIYKTLQPLEGAGATESERLARWRCPLGRTTSQRCWVEGVQGGSGASGLNGEESNAPQQGMMILRLQSQWVTVFSSGIFLPDCELHGIRNNAWHTVTAEKHSAVLLPLCHVIYSAHFSPLQLPALGQGGSVHRTAWRECAPGLDSPSDCQARSTFATILSAVPNTVPSIQEALHKCSFHEWWRQTEIWKIKGPKQY